jgi:hypothetical protein
LTNAIPDFSVHARPSARAASGESETIGYSTEARPLVVHYCGTRGACLRIFILAGQHGDESDARQAASEYLASFESNPSKVVRLAILIDANPDGAAAGKRRNASEMDLNRDHLLLSAPETRAIHSFVGRWQPHLIIDVHTYRAWRPELLQHGFVFAQDVMIDVPTNPAVRLGWPTGTETGLVDFVKHSMVEAAFRCDRYTLVRPSGIVRHSTLDIVDARNMLSLRYRVPTVLLEGRRSSPDDPPIFPPPHLALLRSIEAVVEWVAINAEVIRQQPATTSYSDDLIPVGCRYADLNSSTRYMEMQSARLGDIHVVGIPGLYLPFVRTTRTICAPRAYAVPRSSVNLLEVLARHHFETEAPDRFRRAMAEGYRILCPAPLPVSEGATGTDLKTVERVRLNAEDFILFPTDQPGGRALALFLEPESQFSARRFPALDLGPTDCVVPLASVI